LKNGFGHPAVILSGQSARDRLSLGSIHESRGHHGLANGHLGVMQVGWLESIGPGQLLLLLLQRHGLLGDRLDDGCFFLLKLGKGKD
jgi:hypothetical protein